MQDLEGWHEDPKAFRPFTINKLSNSEMVNLILSYYLGKTGRALDITYGSGTFWRPKQEGWSLEAYDKEPLTPNCKKAEWTDLSRMLTGLYDVVFFDPPYSTGKGGFELDQVEGYSGMKTNAAFTDHMKYGEGLMDLSLEK